MLHAFYAFWNSYYVIEYTQKWCFRLQLNFNLIFNGLKYFVILLLILNYVCISVQLNEENGGQRLWTPWSGSTDCCEPPHEGARNWTRVLYKKCALLTVEPSLQPFLLGFYHYILHSLYKLSTGITEYILKLLKFIILNNGLLLIKNRHAITQDHIHAPPRINLSHIILWFEMII